MRFPTCWDGRLDSEDHQSHVAYAEEGEFNAPCPESHPLRLPKIEFFFRIMPYDGGWHTFSDGSGVFHADYMSGWDEDFLQNVIDNCYTDSFAAMPDSFCEDFLTFKDGPKCTDEDCDFGDPALLEKLHAFQPPALDILSTVSPEETAVVVGDLPRGTCSGELISISSPTDAPVATPTDAPVATPTDPPVDAPETSAPTKAPTTSSPTETPVEETPAPTESPFNDEACYNRPLAFRNEEHKDCDWVANRPGRRCDKTWDEKPLWEICPVACEVECLDCCDITYWECHDSTNAVCDRIEEECAQACEDEAEDFDECIGTVCEKAVDDCHSNHDRCWDSFHACEDSCNA